MDLESSAIWGPEAEGLDASILELTAEEIRQRTSMLNNNIRVIKSELNSVENEIK